MTERQFYAVALDTFGYPEYPVPNWIKGNRYRAVDQGHTLILESETGNFYFAGWAKDNLDKLFSFEGGDN
jgi:hypothetical protein